MDEEQARRHAAMIDRMIEESATVISGELFGDDSMMDVFVDVLRVLHDVAIERTGQDVKWGGPEHDDSHTTQQWIKLMENHLYVALTHSHRHVPISGAMDMEREILQVVALGVACLQSRRRLREREGYLDA